MELTVIGCSGSVSGPESPASCYLVEAPYEGRIYRLLLDLGPGAFGALWGVVDPATVDAIALSHLHPDHCLDLCAFFVAARYSPTAPWPSPLLFGPAGTAARLTRAYDAGGAEPAESKGEVGIADHFRFRDWQPTQPAGPFVVRTARVDHPVEAYAIRVDEVPVPGSEAGPDRRPNSLVYSGDTGPCPALPELARGADLLLVEAGFVEQPDLPVGMHLTGRQAAQAGAEAGVGAVLLTHIPPWRDRDQALAEATPHFAGPVSLATPGSRWTIG